MDWPAGHTLDRSHLSKAESLAFLGLDADRIRGLTDLGGKRIGIGPNGSGAARLVRQVIALLADLDLHLSTYSIDEQLTKVETGSIHLLQISRIGHYDTCPTIPGDSESEAWHHLRHDWL
jgi:hypothetical protein